MPIVRTDVKSAHVVVRRDGCDLFDWSTKFRSGIATTGGGPCTHQCVCTRRCAHDRDDDVSHDKPLDDVRRAETSSPRCCCPAENADSRRPSGQEEKPAGPAGKAPAITRGERSTSAHNRSGQDISHDIGHVGRGHDAGWPRDYRCRHAGHQMSRHTGVETAAEKRKAPTASE